jgi:transcriptional regulator with XRE-family HTH domain
MEIEKLQQARRAKKLSYDDLAKLTGYSRSTITNIFCGYIEFPRHETIQAIERALGLDEEKRPPSELTEGEQELFNLISQLTEDEIDELSNFIDYIISKRK